MRLFVCSSVGHYEFNLFSPFTTFSPLAHLLWHTQKQSHRHTEEPQLKLNDSSSFSFSALALALAVAVVLANECVRPLTRLPKSIFKHQLR